MITANQHRAESERVRGEQHVLNRRRAVLHPESLVAFEREIAADDDAERRGLKRVGVRVKLRDRIELLALAHDHEVPRLLVARRRRRHCRLE